MRAIHIEFLEAGALPFYHIESEGLIWNVDIHHHEAPGIWEARAIRNNRALIQLWMADVMLADVERRVTGWLDMLGENDGSLIVPIQHIWAIPPGEEGGESPGTIVGAGLAFCPGVTFGMPLDGADPARLIVEVVEADGVNNDHLHPAVLHARQERIRLREVMTQEAIKNSAKRIIVEARSRALLQDCLTPQQHQELLDYDHFHVMSPDGYTYAIHRGGCYNRVYRVEDGVRTMTYCIHPKKWEENLPGYDLMLGLKLLLECDPDTFHRTANYVRLED